MLVVKPFKIIELQIEMGVYFLHNLCVAWIMKVVIIYVASAALYATANITDISNKEKLNGR